MQVQIQNPVVLLPYDILSLVEEEERVQLVGFKPEVVEEVVVVNLLQRQMDALLVMCVFFSQVLWAFKFAIVV